MELISEEDVLSTIFSFKEYSGYSKVAQKIYNLPKCGDLSEYGVPEATEEALWKHETKRLVTLVNFPEEPLLFRSATRALGEDTKDGYTNLAKLASLVLGSHAITALDDQFLMHEHCPAVESGPVTVIHRRLLNRFLENLEKNPIEKRKDVDQEVSEFVDYLSGMIARLLCASASGKMWYSECLATLAVWSAKTKIVSRDPAGYGKRCIANDYEEDEEIAGLRNAGLPEVARNTKENRRKDGSIGELSSMLGALKRIQGNHNENKDDSDSAEGPLKHTYWVQISSARAYIGKIIVRTLLELRGSSTIYVIDAPMAYEMSSEIYDTGLEGFRALVHQERDGALSGTSNRECLSVSCHAFKLAYDTARNINKASNSRSEAPSFQLSKVGTFVSWLDPEKAFMRRRVGLNSMEDILSAMIAIHLTDPRVADDIKDFIHVSVIQPLLSSSGEDFDESVRVKTAWDSNFMDKASFCLSTSEFTRKQDLRRSASLGGQTSPVPLSTALFTRDQLLLEEEYGNHEITPNQTWSHTGTNESLIHTPVSQTQREERILARKDKLLRSMEVMNGWEFDEMAVLVNCRKYVLMVLALSTILVCGGLAIGFTVKERIRGVDPFNITTYLWVLAAFVILIAKYIRVEQWPWRDFLRMQVVCRSVTELASVSGIDKQMILAKLLNEEHTSRLKTRGPFNAAFMRQADGAEGFSIDEPIHFKTLLLSGLIMVKVLTFKGEALVCLDLRKGAELSSLEHSHVRPEESHIYCDLSRFGVTLSIDTEKERAVERRTKPKLSLEKGKVEWNRILGFATHRRGESDSVFY